jgi:hypothetical protein
LSAIAAHVVIVGCIGYGSRALKGVHFDSIEPDRRMLFFSSPYLRNKNIGLLELKKRKVERF